MSEPKLCPFRTAKVYRILLAPGVDPAAHEIPQDEFFPCLQDKCAMWRMTVYQVLHQCAIIDGHAMAFEGKEPNQVGFCGLAGKP